MQIIGVDVNDITFSCMDSYEAESSCVAASPTKNGPVWNLRLPRIKVVAGAALAPERLYVATRDGTLFAVGSAVSSAEGTPARHPSFSRIPDQPGRNLRFLVTIFGPWQGTMPGARCGLKKPVLRPPISNGPSTPHWDLTARR